MTIQNTQLSVLGINTERAGDDINPPTLSGPEHSTGPAPRGKLAEGWVTTSQGDVFVSPGGLAWVVERRGDALVSVPVKIIKEDIIGNPSAIRTKRAAAERQRYKTRVSARKAASLTVGEAAIANGEVLEVS